MSGFEAIEQFPESDQLATATHSSHDDNNSPETRSERQLCGRVDPIFPAPKHAAAADL